MSSECYYNCHNSGNNSVMVTIIMGLWRVDEVTGSLFCRGQPQGL